MPRKYENNNSKIQKNFTIVENDYLQDKKLRAVEMGILTKLLSLPPTFDVSIQGIAYAMNESSELIRKSFKNLIENGYMTDTKKTEKRTRGENGKFVKTSYLFSGKPIFLQTENVENEENISENDVTETEVSKSKSRKNPRKNVTETESTEPEISQKSGQNQEQTTIPCLENHTRKTISGNPYMENHIRKTISGNPDMENQIRKSTSGKPYLENTSYTYSNNSNSQNSNNQNSINNHFLNNNSINQSTNQNTQKNQSDGTSLTQQQINKIKSSIAEKIELENIKNGEYGDNNGNFYNKNRMQIVNLFVNAIANTIKYSYQNPDYYYDIKDIGRVTILEMRVEMGNIDRILLDYIIFQIEDRELSSNEPIKNYEAYIRSCIYRALKNDEHKIWSERYLEDMGFYWSCWSEKYTEIPDFTEENNQEISEISDNTQEKSEISDYSEYVKICDVGEERFTSENIQESEIADIKISEISNMSEEDFTKYMENLHKTNNKKTQITGENNENKYEISIKIPIKQNN